MLMVSACPESGFLGHAARPRATSWLVTRFWWCWRAWLASCAR